MLSAMIEMEATTVSVPVATARMEHIVKVRPQIQGDNGSYYNEREHESEKN